MELMATFKGMSLKKIILKYLWPACILTFYAPLVFFISYLSFLWIIHLSTGVTENIYSLILSTLTTLLMTLIIIKVKSLHAVLVPFACSLTIVFGFFTLSGGWQDPYFGTELTMMLLGLVSLCLFLVIQLLYYAAIGVDKIIKKLQQGK